VASKTLNKVLAQNGRGSDTGVKPRTKVNQ